LDDLKKEYPYFFDGHLHYSVSDPALSTGLSKTIDEVQGSLAELECVRATLSELIEKTVTTLLRDAHSLIAGARGSAREHHVNSTVHPCLQLPAVLDLSGS
jgi:hypothetical protein